MTEMLFGNLYEEYVGEDLSDTIGDQWMCDCEEECDECPCKVVDND